MWFLVCFLITLATFWYKSNACRISLVTMFDLKPNLENRIPIIYAIVWIDMFKKWPTNHSYWSSAIGFAIFELLSSNVISCSGSCNVSINISIDWYLISLFTFPFPLWQDTITSLIRWIPKWNTTTRWATPKTSRIRLVAFSLFILFCILFATSTCIN